MISRVAMIVQIVDLATAAVQMIKSVIKVALI
jgi:hypothetical protein